MNIENKLKASIIHLMLSFKKPLIKKTVLFIAGGLIIY
jgi:hypothetical protein